MPEIQNVGAVDYVQYQPTQYPNNAYATDYNMQPEVYDENAEQIKSTSKSKLGATLISGALVGLALWGSYALGKKSGKKDLPEVQNVADKYKEFLDNQAKELEKEADEVRNANIFHWKKGGEFADKVKEAIKKLREAVEGTKDEAKEGATKAAEEGKSAAEDATK